MSTPTTNPDLLDTVGFIIAVEDGTITQEQFDASAQAFADSGTWRHLQGSWGRLVHSWADHGFVELQSPNT